MNEDLVCPYCKAEQLNHEPDEISADMCLTQCDECGHAFWYSVVVTRFYDSTPYDDEETGEDNVSDVLLFQG